MPEEFDKLKEGKYLTNALKSNMWALMMFEE